MICEWLEEQQAMKPPQTRCHDGEMFDNLNEVVYFHFNVYFARDGFIINNYSCWIWAICPKSIIMIAMIELQTFNPF